MGVFNNVLIAIAVTASACVVVAEASAQKPDVPAPAEQRLPSPGVKTPASGAEQTVEGQVKNVNASGTEITLTDGTTLVTPPGAAIRPGLLAEGAIVVASYRELNGQKVLTDLQLKEPAASPPAMPRSPAEPPAAPPSKAPPRY
jgi:hypothetical protein